MDEPETFHVVAPDGGERLLWLEGEIRYLASGEATGGRYCALIGETRTGEGAPPHVHLNDEEAFFVLEGGPVTFKAGDAKVDLPPGGFVNISPGTAHTFTNDGAPARMVLLLAPAGFDRFQREASLPAGSEPISQQDMLDRIEAVAPKHGYNMHPDPALFERAPEFRVVLPGDEPAVELGEGVTAVSLASGGHTHSRYAVLQVDLDDGAELPLPDDLPASIGIFVVSGDARLVREAGTLDLAAESFAHLPVGDPTGLIVAEEGAVRLLLWAAPAQDLVAALTTA